MALFRSLINKFWNKKKSEDVDFKGSHGILIKPDGTWSISTPPKAPAYNPPKIIRQPQQPIVPGKDYLLYDTDSSLEVLSFPPDYFPHAKELYGKLEKCIDMDVITSCIHKQTQNSVYILTVELPCGENHAENIRKFKAFVSAMESTYKLTAVQQERINSTTCADKFYLVVFEYDPRKFFIPKVKDDKD